MYFDSPDLETVREKLLAAASRFDRELGVVLGQRELDEITAAGWDQVSAESVCEAIVNELDKGISKAGARATAYWALGKWHSIEMLPFFRTSLCAELERDVDAVYQILIALDNLNEPVFGNDRRGQVGSDEVELNLRDARAYLSRN